jgi:drug/metabolite transporter (DMT)-like permease
MLERWYRPRRFVNNLRVLSGALLLLAGIALVFVPDQVGEALQRPATTAGDAINLRASWGGTLAGIGAFVLARPSLRPWRETVATLVLCSMAAVGLARAIGFVLDGDPDTRQWVWLVAEVALVAVSAAYLRRRRSARTEKRASS